MKKKIGKIVFVVSFLPYIIIVLISLYFAIFGYDVQALFGGGYIETQYGIDAFLSIFTGLLYIYCTWIPVLPVVAIYQIIYLIIKRLKRRK